MSIYVERWIEKCIFIIHSYNVYLYTSNIYVHMYIHIYMCMYTCTCIYVTYMCVIYKIHIWIYITHIYNIWYTIYYSIWDNQTRNSTYVSAYPVDWRMRDNQGGVQWTHVCGTHIGQKQKKYSEKREVRRELLNDRQIANRECRRTSPVLSSPPNKRIKSGDVGRGKSYFPHLSHLLTARREKRPSRSGKKG